MAVTRDWEERRDIDQKLQIPSYKINKFWRANVQYSDYGDNNVHFKFTKRVDFKCSHQKKKVVFPFYLIF